MRGLGAARGLAASQVDGWNRSEPSRPNLKRVLTVPERSDHLGLVARTHRSDSLVTSMSGLLAAGYEAQNAIVKNGTTRPSHTPSAAGSWWAIDFGNTNGFRFDASAIHIQQRIDAGTNLHGNLSIRGGNDFSTWDTIATITSPTQAQSAWNTVAATNGSLAPYRYMMVYHNSADSGAANYLVLGSVEIFGTLYEL